MRRLGAAVVGVGVGRSHLEALARLPDRYAIAAICDLDANRAGAARDAIAPAAAIETDAERLFARADVDVVAICTPPATHLPLASAALAAGKHVVCEKPLVGSLAECDILGRAAEKARTLLLPVFQYRFGAGARRFRRIVELGLAGRPYLATSETTWVRKAEYYAVPWRGKWASELGGVLLTQAIHQHDLATWIMGPARRVQASMATRVNPIEVEDCLAASVMLESGAVATLAATLGAAREMTRLKFFFEHVEAESNHEAYHPGRAPWRVIWKSPERERAAADALDDFDPGRERNEGMYDAFHRAIVDGAPLPVTLADARASLELATALYHSHATGTAVDLPIGAGHPRYANWRL